MDSKGTSWFLNDDSCLQYCRCAAQDTFELIEMGECPEGSKNSHYYHRGTVNVKVRLEDDKEDVLNILNSFGYQSLGEVQTLYGEDANQIIAECIFESEGAVNGGGHECKFFSSENACIEAIKAIVERR